jgi:hypothetical protein
MSHTVTGLPDAVREQVVVLFRDRAPVLVEVRFPGMGASSDWYLFESEDELEQLRRRLARGVEVHLASVWDVEMRRGEISFRL